jgi:hypothetical protein
MDEQTQLTSEGAAESSSPMTPYNDTQNISQALTSPYRSTGQIAACALVLSIIIILTILGNLTVLLSIFQTRSLREQVSNFLIANLAITDLGSSLTVMLFAFVNLITDAKQSNPFLCNLIYYCINVVIKFH